MNSSKQIPQGPPSKLSRSTTFILPQSLQAIPSILPTQILHLRCTTPCSTRTPRHRFQLLPIRFPLDKPAMRRLGSSGWASIGTARIHCRHVYPGEERDTPHPSSFLGFNPCGAVNNRRSLHSVFNPMGAIELQLYRSPSGSCPRSG